MIVRHYDDEIVYKVKLMAGDAGTSGMQKQSGEAVTF